MLVNFSRGFQSKVQTSILHNSFKAILEEVYELMKMYVVMQMPELQEHIIKFIERNVTILGSATQPLIIESSLIQINQILDVTDGEQISKLPPVMRML